MQNTVQNTPHYLIIPAAGLGTRMRTVHPDLPKELLSVGHKPAIQYAVEEGLSAGIKNIIIIISSQKEILRNYFEDPEAGGKLFPGAASELEKIRKEARVFFLYQKKLLGESDAISYARDIAGRSPIAVIYPDNLYLPAPGALKQLVSVYEKYTTDVIALNEVKRELSDTISNAGRVDITQKEHDVYDIVRLLPKDAGHFKIRYNGELRACGMYISGPFIFDYIERARKKIRDGEITDTPVRNLVLKERGLIGCRLPGTVFDIGNPAGYRKCLSYLEKQTDSLSGQSPA